MFFQLLDQVNQLNYIQGNDRVIQWPTSLKSNPSISYQILVNRSIYLPFIVMEVWIRLWPELK